MTTCKAGGDQISRGVDLAGRLLDSRSRRRWLTAETLRAFLLFACATSQMGAKGDKNLIQLLRGIYRFVLTIAMILGIARAETNGSPVSGLDVYLHPQTVAVLPDGRKVHFFCTGEGTPTAILDAGWGSWSTSWRAFQPKVAQFTRVCAFDRPGYGFSDPGPLPRDTAATVADLHAGLHAAGLASPYVLVGHSLAGFDVRLFAYDYPDEVAGLLLIDPPTEKIYQRDRAPDEDLDSVRNCIAIAKIRRLVVNDKDGCIESPSLDWSNEMQAHQIEVGSKLTYFETELSEDLSMVGTSADEVAAARHDLGNLPLILLQADSSPENERSKELRDQARDSARGQYRIVKGARHYIYVDKPDMVVAAFREIINSAREGSGPPQHQ
jgi:pimeloyl-ACP methyl ester carboxylesterase